MSRWLAWWCGCALALAATAAWGDPPAADGAGVLLLRNGHLLAGRIVRLGDFYTVELTGGGSMRIPATQVDLACRDLPEAYRTKLAGINAASPHQRLDLAEWCLRHSLPAEAAEQMLSAARLDPSNPRIAPLERKLLALADQATAPPVAVPAAAPEPVRAEPELDVSISPAALAAFTGTIQPLLLNRCGTTTCHGGPGNTGFHITRSPFGPQATQRLTKRNLAAVMAYVDRAAPEKSRLLTVPRASHGTAKLAVFSDRDLHQWQDLSNWVAAVVAPDGTAFQPAANPPAPGVPAEIEGTRPPWLANPAGPTSPAAPPKITPPKITLSPSADRPPAVRMTIGPAASLPGDFEPRDPFDPEIFHRLTASPEKK